MKRPGAEFLQWFGLVGAALAWTVQHVVGFGFTVANCGAGGKRWGIPVHGSELVLMGIALAFVLASEAAAVVVLLQTRGLEDSAPPPEGRRHFFAVAAAAGGVLFFVAILLSGISVVTHTSCNSG